MNSITLTGRITKDIELKSTQTGKTVSSITIAVKRPMTKDTTDFINVILWEQKAKFISDYAKKGNRIGVTGYLTARNYEDKDGNKRTAFEVNATDVEILESKTESATQQPMTPIADDDDLPF